MIKASLIISVLGLLLALQVNSPVFAQEEKYYIKDTATVIVGEGNEGGTVERPGPGPAPDCPPGGSTKEIDDALKDEFGVIVKEGGNWYGLGSVLGPENVNCETRRSIYRAYALPSQSGAFRRKLEPWDPFSFECYRSNGPYAHVHNKDLLQFSNCINIRENFTVYGFLALHETGHIIATRKGSLYRSFPHRQLVNQDGRDCYGNRVNNYVIRTYGIFPRDAKSESFAEAIALYVYNKKTYTVLASLPLDNFKVRCRNTYNWMRDNVFGGYEFNL